MSDDVDIQTALRGYAPAAADNGFTAATLMRAKQAQSFRAPILITAACAGGLVMLSQMPSLWRALANFGIPTTSPLALTALGVLGFVGWAALDKGWSDAV